MSCSIDPRRGSIMMEFVLVLPIYIFLFGAVCLIGDMGLNAIRISTGDRDAAMDAGDRTGHSVARFLSLQMRDEKTKVSFSSRTHRADEKFQGAWSWQTAARASFAYVLPSYGAGLVSYPYLRYGDASSGGGILGTLVGGGTVVFHGKDFSLSGNVRAYNYYTLRRTEIARDPRAYRNWNPDQLVKSSGGRQYWESGVYDEPFADSDCRSLESNGRQGRDYCPDPPSGVPEYTRNPRFVEWSE